MNAEVEGEGYSPTVRKRRLSAILVDLRHQRGMTVTQVCRELEMSRWSMHRIENALWVKPKPRDVKDLCELYGVSQSETGRLMELAREARQRGWWRRYDDVLTGDFAGFESGASAISVYEPTLITGLLQTPAYMRRIAAASGVTDEDEIERRVAARQERQEILDREDPPDLHVVLDEATILRPVGTTAERREQLEHLHEIAKRPNVSVRLLRLEDGPHPAIATGAFMIFDFPHPQERPLVFMETEVDSRYLEEPDELERYRLLWSRVREAALSTEDTLAHLEKITHTLE